MVFGTSNRASPTLREMLLEHPEAMHLPYKDAILLMECQRTMNKVKAFLRDLGNLCFGKRAEVPSEDEIGRRVRVWEEFVRPAPERQEERIGALSCVILALGFGSLFLASKAVIAVAEQQSEAVVKAPAIENEGSAQMWELDCNESALKLYQHLYFWNRLKERAFACAKKGETVFFRGYYQSRAQEQIKKLALLVPESSFEKSVKCGLEEPFPEKALRRDDEGLRVRYAELLKERQELLARSSQTLKDQYGKAGEIPLEKVFLENKENIHKIFKENV